MTREEVADLLEKYHWRLDHNQIKYWCYVKGSFIICLYEDSLTLFEDVPRGRGTTTKIGGSILLEELTKHPYREYVIGPIVNNDNDLVHALDLRKRAWVYTTYNWREGMLLKAIPSNTSRKLETI